MTTLIGNICLALAVLIFMVFFTPVFYHRISQSNDQGASGYMIIIVGFLHLIILGLMAAVYIAINRHGGFDWVSGKPGLRILLLSIGLLSAVIISAIGIMTRLIPGTNPALLQFIMKFAPVTILIVLVGTGFILNNAFLRESIPPLFYKWPLILLDTLCLAGIIIMMLSALFTPSSSARDATMKYESEESIKNSRLEEIESSDAKENMVRILEFTGAVYPMEVREKASAKVRTNPEWRKDLIYLLENDQPIEVFSFLQSNEVDDKNLFLQPVYNGVMAVATRIRRTIQATGPDEFSKDMFSDEVNSVLQTIDKFKGMGVDYLPAVKEMRSALDESTHGSKIKFDCVATLDNWIGK